MVELKVYVDGIQRVVCGVNDSTSCQDIIIALAQATGQTGRFKLVERSQTNEKRTLKPHEKPLHVMSKWNKAAIDAYFMLLSIGDTPSNSRPPSSIGLPIDRFRQLGDGSDLSEFPKQRQASIRRSMTFSGYKSGTTKVKELKEKVNEKAEKLCHELTELIDMQKQRLAQQEERLSCMDAELEGLGNLDHASEHERRDEEIEEMERTIQANKSAIEEDEFWEQEFEIEEQLQSELLREISVLRDQVVLCEENIKLRRNEAKQIQEQIEREQGRQKRVAEERLQRDLDAVQGEVTLLEEEYVGYSANLEETNTFLGELETVYREKITKEKKLNEKIAAINSKVKNCTVPVIDTDEQLVPELRVPLPTSTSVSTTIVAQHHQSKEVEEFLTLHPLRRFKGSPRELVEAAPSSDNPDGIYV